MAIRIDSIGSREKPWSFSDSTISFLERNPGAAAYLTWSSALVAWKIGWSLNRIPLMIVHFLFFCRCVAGMAEKLREAAARGDVARVARLLDEDIKPLPDEVSFLFSLLFNIFFTCPQSSISNDIFFFFAATEEWLNDRKNSFYRFFLFVRIPGDRSGIFFF